MICRFLHMLLIRPLYYLVTVLDLLVVLQPLQLLPKATEHLLCNGWHIRMLLVIMAIHQGKLFLFSQLEADASNDLISRYYTPCKRSNIVGPTTDFVSLLVVGRIDDSFFISCKQVDVFSPLLRGLSTFVV